MDHKYFSGFTSVVVTVRSSTRIKASYSATYHFIQLFHQLCFSRIYFMKLDSSALPETTKVWITWTMWFFWLLVNCQERDICYQDMDQIHDKWTLVKMDQSGSALRWYWALKIASGPPGSLPPGSHTGHTYPLNTSGQTLGKIFTELIRKRFSSYQWQWLLAEIYFESHRDV